MPSITQTLSGPSTQQPYGRLFWLMLGSLAAAQLVAFGFLCSQQVRKAQARETHYVVQQMALTDCLQYTPSSTIASCSQRVDLVRTAAPRDSAMAGVMPASYNYR